MIHSHRPALRTTLFYVLLIAVTLFAAWLIDYCTRFAPSGFSDPLNIFPLHATLQPDAGWVPMILRGTSPA
jgi:hypothetical protein